MFAEQEEVALIRAIVADPDEDTTRLAYADWLDEHGRRDRARLIRVQCSLVHLQAEEKELIEKHGREWGQELLGAGGDDWKFHRGFPEEVTMMFSHYFGAHERLNDVTPLTRLHLLGGTDDHVRQLAALPAARQIRTLEIDYPSRNPPPGENFGAAGVRALAASPHLRGVREVRLHSHQIGEAGAEIIAGSPTFTHLTHLVLTDPSLGAAAGRIVPLIASSPNLSRLVELQCGEARYGTSLLRLARSQGPGQADDRGPP